MNTFLLRCVPALALLSLFAGCATTTVASDPLELPANSGQSPVVVSITANTGEIQGFNQIQVRRILADDAPAEYFILQQAAPGMARDTALFIGALPPGNYEFSSLTDLRTRKVLELRNGARLLGSFPVRANTPADLGRLVVTPVNMNVVFGRSARVGSNRALLERFSPKHAPLFAAAPASGWGRDRLELDKVEEYATARPVGAQCATELADGQVAAASRLGAVLLRAKDGRWRALRSPGIDSLMCVAEAGLPNAELLAVGEFGTLLRKPPGKDELVPVPTGDLPPGSLVSIAGNPKAGWYVALQSATDVTLFHTADIESGKWTALRKESVAFDIWRGANVFWMWGDKAGMGYAVSAGPIRRLDYASGQWTDYATPNKERLVGLTVDPAGSMGALTSPGGGFAGVFAGVWVSNDMARSWQPVTVPFKIKYAPIQRAHDGTMYVAGGVMSQPELQVSKDQGKTWSLAARYELGRQLLPLRSGELLDFDAAHYGIFSIGHSGDGGKTWRYEYSNFDRAAYDARKK